MHRVAFDVNKEISEVANLEAKRISQADEYGSKHRWAWMRELLSLKSVEVGGKQVTITLADKAVGCFIASYINTDESRGPLHKAWPNEDTIAESIGLHKRSVRRSLAKLEMIGRLHVERRRGGIYIDENGTRRGRSNLYSIRHPMPEKVAPVSHKGALVSPIGAPVSPIPGLPGATSTILNHYTVDRNTTESEESLRATAKTESVAPSEEIPTAREEIEIQSQATESEKQERVLWSLKDRTNWTKALDAWSENGCWPTWRCDQDSVPIEFMEKWLSKRKAAGVPIKPYFEKWIAAMKVIRHAPI